MYIQRNETGLYLYIAEKLLACEKHEEALNYFRKAYEQDGDSLKVLCILKNIMYCHKNKGLKRIMQGIVK